MAKYTKMMSTVSTVPTVPDAFCPGFDSDGCPWKCKTHGLCGECEYHVAMQNTKLPSVAITKVKQQKHGTNKSTVTAPIVAKIASDKKSYDVDKSDSCDKKRHSGKKLANSKTTHVTINIHNTYNTYL